MRRRSSSVTPTWLCMIPGHQRTATGGPACPPRRAVDMPAGSTARHRAPRHGASSPDAPRADASYPYGQPPGDLARCSLLSGGPPFDGPPSGGLPPGGPPRRTRRLSRRARFLLCGLVVLPLLAGAGVYLTRGAVPAPAPAAGAPFAAPPAAPPPASSPP